MARGRQFEFEQRVDQRLGIALGDDDRQSSRSADFDPLLAPAQQFIRREGVLTIPSWGKLWLALLGLYDWRGVPPLGPGGVTSSAMRSERRAATQSTLA